MELKTLGSHSHISLYIISMHIAYHIVSYYYIAIHFILIRTILTMLTALFYCILHCNISNYLYHVVLNYTYIYSEKFWANTHTQKHTAGRESTVSVRAYIKNPSIRTIYTHISDKWHLVEHLTNPHPEYSILHSQSFQPTCWFYRSSKQPRVSSTHSV